MMIAAAHLANGDVLVVVPDSDEPSFDRYEGGEIDAPVIVRGAEPRFGGDVDHLARTRTFVDFADEYRARVWDNTRLLDVTR